MTERRHLAGFTLVELLVVVAIIALLLGILLPALAAVRGRASNVAAAAQLESISRACDSYFTTFNDYPGYFADADILGPITQSFPGNHNLMVSLIGQMTTSSSEGEFQVGSTGRYIDTDKIGEGPRVESGRVYGAFYSPKAGELQVLNSDWGSGAVDEPLTPVDRAAGAAIFYYRRIPGRTDLVSKNNGKFNKDSHNLYFGDSDGYEVGDKKFDVRANSMLVNGVAGSPGAADENLAWVAANRTLYDGSGNINSEGVARGAYILMTGGEDGIQMNTEDLDGDTTIDDFGDVDRFDDVIVVGGS